MKRLAFAAALAGMALVSTQASAKYGVSNYYGFTSSFVGSLTAGSGTTFGTQPLFLGNPRYVGFSSMIPTITGSTLNIPIPAGRHSSRWWRVFTVFQSQQIARVLTSAGIIGGGKGGAGVPGPIAGASLPILALAGAFALLRRRRDGLKVA